jgi:hypothetical protein
MMLRSVWTAGILLVLAGVPALSQAVVKTENGQGARLKALDTVTGEVSDLELAVGGTIRYERLQITLEECRYPAENISADAFAYLIIQDERSSEPNFSGWMIASSPALSALEHPRYDVWVTRCTTSS